MFKNLLRYMIPDFSDVYTYIDYRDISIPDTISCRCNEKQKVNKGKPNIEKNIPQIRKMHRCNSKNDIDQLPDMQKKYGISHQRVNVSQMKPSNSISHSGNSNSISHSGNSNKVSYIEAPNSISQSGNTNFKPKTSLEIFDLNCRMAKSMLSNSNEVNCEDAERYIEDYMERTQDTWFIPGLSQKLSVIFDIDDTLIDYLNRPIIPVIKLYNKCREYAYVLDINGYALITIFIITARLADPHVMDHTEKMLSDINIDKYDKIYYRKTAEDDPEAYKLECRKHIHDRGYNTILSVGDMYWDLGKYGGKSLMIL